MAVRSTAKRIREIKDTDPNLPDSVFTPYIRIANNLINTVCAKSTYTLEVFTDIETWLAAHFFAITEKQTVQEQVEDVMETFQSKVDYNLNLTHWGQTAMVLDTDGYLAAYNNALRKVVGVLPAGKKKVGVTWLGSVNETAPT